MKHTLQNTGENINNDVVLPGNTFELPGKKYNFKIRPRTKYWRFGIRLSKTPDVEFFHPNHRYKTPEFKQYIDIHIGVGEWNNTEWSLPNRLHLAQYNIPKHEHLIFRADRYQEHSEILWLIQKDEKSNVFTSLLISKENEPAINSLEIDPEFKYFKVFAWSDKTEFKIEMELSIGDFEIIPTSTAKQFELPTLELNTHERKYLEILYDVLLENKVIDNPLQIVQMWNEQQFPKEFTYESINSLLASGTQIKIWGVWHVDPSSTLFVLINRVILTIKWILQNTQTRLHNITSQMILAYCPEITEIEVDIVFKLVCHLPDFSRGYGTTSNNRIFHINISDPKVYDQYRKFTDFQSYMLEYLRNYGIAMSDTANSGSASLVSNTSIPSSFIFGKTPIPSIARSQLTPVLGVKEVAADFAGIILALPEDKGQMLGVFGKWGRGKSFLIEQIWEHLKKNSQPEFIRVDYHAWKYQETPASWAYLYELLVRKYEGDKKGIKNYVLFCWRRIKLNYKRVGLLPMLLPAFAFITTIGSWILSLAKFDLTFTVFAIPATLLIFIKINKDLEERYGFSTSELLKKYVSRFSFKDKLGVQAEIQEELIKLLKVWLPKETYKTKKILLIVEDLDRCTEDKIIQNIDSLRIMLDDTEISNRILILTAIDERILKNAVRSKYKTYLKDEITAKDNEGTLLLAKTNELVSEYLDKLFISAIKLGSLNDNQTGEFFRELIKNQITNETTDPEQQTVLAGLPVTDMNNPALSAEVIPSDSSKTKVETNEDESPQVENVKTTSLSLSTNLEKLTMQEVGYLEQALKDWNAMTPRKIYIFYYRYLLCKNLLIKKYEKAKIENGWQDAQSIKSLLFLLINFSKNCDPNSITEEKERVASESTNDVLLKQFDTKVESQKKLKSDYLFLLEVFELVIAY